MRYVKWFTLVLLCGITTVGVAAGVTTPVQYQMRMSLRQAELDGDALFHSPALSTNGQTCDTCHIDGGRFSHRLGSRRLPSLVGAKRAFPDVNSEGEVTTLENQINQCIVQQLHGSALAPKSRRLGLLDLYVRHLSRFHER